MAPQRGAGRMPSPPWLPARFAYRRELGTGTYGRVVEARDTGEADPARSLVAIKLLPIEVLEAPASGKYVLQEACIHGSARCPHVVGVREVFESARHVGVVMERAAGGTLLRYADRHFFRRRRALPEHLVRWFLQQLVSAVSHVHEVLQCSHRDIKLENILLEDAGDPDVPDCHYPVILLTDFGFATYSDGLEKSTSVVGTDGYVAPEVWKQALSQAGYDAQVADVYSIGVCMYIMLYKRHPVANGNFEVDLQAHRISAPSPPCLSLLRRLLEPDPDRRIKLRELWKDPWFRKRPHQMREGFKMGG